MAAEFDSSGFSAVDKFFGGERDRATIDKETRVTASTPFSNRGKRRGGVGVSIKSIDSGSKPLSSDLLAKKVLTVGRKRGRDDVVEDEYDVVDDHGVHDADEGDGGRTSIAPKKPAVSKSLNETTQTSKPSKKLGRKERERQKQLAAKAEAEKNQEAAPRPPSSDAGVVQNEGANDTGNHQDSTQVKPKKKRRKVRSRQKNIRKDNRSAEEKPAHLIPGSRNYKGRPMTQATREKLNLPPPVKKPFRGNFSNNNEANDSSLFVIDRAPDATGDDLGVKLAIDEWMGGDDKGQAENNASNDKPETKDKKKSSKKRKRKFKNL